MDREIKFRVWDGEQMVSPDYINRDGVAWWKSNSIPNHSNKLMQFTGLKDKKKKEIYEADLLMYAGKIAEVRYYEEKMAFGLYFHDDNTWLHVWNCPDKIIDLKVIGNIYQHPELLKQEQPHEH